MTASNLRSIPRTIFPPCLLPRTTKFSIRYHIDPNAERYAVRNGIRFCENTSKPFPKAVFSGAGFSRHQGALFRRFYLPEDVQIPGFPPLFPAKPPPLPQSQFAIKTAFGLFASRRHLQANRILKNICNIRRGNQNRHRHCN